MSLSAGTQFGPYEIISPLGAGGMGEVYRAKDSKLDREVAIKVLPDAFARDPERVARFQREAKVLASLNHPNIAAIYGFETVSDTNTSRAAGGMESRQVGSPRGTSDSEESTGLPSPRKLKHAAQGLSFLVMELVEGETLSQKIKNGPLDVEDTLQIHKQMAEALEAAHEKGIIHRDLKPANVMIREDGTVKVLDFGLAKAIAGGDDHSQTEIANSPTITADFTRPGVVMGTAAYMSPEQARGKPIDKRTDIWSFGVVLFECLTGSRPFEGDTTSDMIARILEREPEWSNLPHDTPPLIQLLIRRCLAKNHKRRLRDIGDARINIETSLDDPTTSGFLLAHDALSVGTRRRWRRTASMAFLLAVATLIGGGIGWLIHRAEPITQPQILRFAVDIPKGYSFSQEDEGTTLNLNPAGTMITYVAEAQGKRHIFIQDLSKGEARLVSGTEGASQPFFSTNGRWIGFFARNQLMKIPVRGGPPLLVYDGGGGYGTWLDNGTIAFINQNKKILLVSDKGGTPRELATAGLGIKAVDDKQLLLGFTGLQAVPGADYLLASVWDGVTIRDYDIVSISLADGTIRPVMHRAVDARYLAPGHLIFLRESSVLAVPFDVERGVVTGEAFQVIDGVLTDLWAEDGQFAISANGTLAYVPGKRRGPGRRLIRVDSSGHKEPIMEGTDTLVGGIRVSPNGRYVSVVTLRRQIELWTFNLDSRVFTLINNIGEVWSPTWTIDSNALLFQRVTPEQEPQILLKRLDAGSPAESISIGISGNILPTSFSHDGKLLLLDDARSDAHDVLLHHWGEDGQPAVVLETMPADNSAMFSPTSNHFAYVSNETGRNEVFIQIYPGTGRRWQVSRDGGSTQRWSRDGKSLFFLDFKNVMYKVNIETEPNFQVSSPERLFDTTKVATTILWGSYDVLPNGDFIMVEPADWEKNPVRIHVVTNWVTELSK